MRPRDRFPYTPRVQAIDIAGRVPPHNLDAEAAVLSALMLDGGKLDELAFLKPEHFYSATHRRIFEAARELAAKSVPIDIQTLAAWLKDREWLQAIGGVSMLAKIVDATPAVAHLEAHGRIVLDKARVRALIDASQQTAAEGFGDYGDAKEFVDLAESRIHALARDDETSSASLLFDLMRGSFERLARAGSRSVTGVPTGFRDVDEMTTGMQKGELIVIAARPGMGKTAYVMNVAVNAASAVVDTSATAADGTVDEHVGVMVFSLEMPREQLASRMLCGDAGDRELRTLRRLFLRALGKTRACEYSTPRVENLPRRRNCFRGRPVDALHAARRSRPSPVTSARGRRP